MYVSRAAQTIFYSRLDFSSYGWGVGGEGTPLFKLAEKPGREAGAQPGDLPYHFLDGFANVFQRVLSNRFVHSLSFVVFPFYQVVGLQQGQKTFI